MMAIGGQSLDWHRPGTLRLWRGNRGRPGSGAGQAEGLSGSRHRSLHSVLATHMQWKLICFHAMCFPGSSTDRYKKRAQTGLPIGSLFFSTEITMERSSKPKTSSKLEAKNGSRTVMRSSRLPGMCLPITDLTAQRFVTSLATAAFRLAPSTTTMERAKRFSMNCCRISQRRSGRDQIRRVRGKQPRSHAAIQLQRLSGIHSGAGSCTRFLCPQSAPYPLLPVQTSGDERHCQRSETRPATRSADRSFEPDELEQIASLIVATGWNCCCNRVTKRRSHFPRHHFAHQNPCWRNSELQI